MFYHPLSQIFLKQANHNTVAFGDNGDISWQQFKLDICSLIALIESNQCSRIALCCEDSYHFAVAFFATIYAGKSLIIPGNYQPAMLLSLSCEFDLLIDDGVLTQTTKQQLPQTSITLPTTINPQAEFNFHELDLDKLYLTLFTSGSTGEPKAIVKSLRMLGAEVDSLQAHFASQVAGTRIVSTVSHQHIYGLLFRLLWPLCSGLPFAQQNLIYPEQVVAHAQQLVTLISSPALLKRLQVSDGQGSYRAVFSSGGPLPYQAAKISRTVLAQTPIEVFGSTETGGIGYRQQFQADSTWQFFESVVAHLGELSCLALRSPWLSERSDGKNYYQTSDQCELLENHQFKLKGRIDRIVKIEEKRISLQEVETHLNELEWIEESVVIVINEPHRVTLGALLVLTEQGLSELQKIGKGRFWIMLRQALRNWLEPVGIPRHFRISDEIPVNSQGKRLAEQITELF